MLIGQSAKGAKVFAVATRFLQGFQSEPRYLQASSRSGRDYDPAGGSYGMKYVLSGSGGLSLRGL